MTSNTNTTYAAAVENARAVYAATDVSDASIVKRCKSAHDVLTLAKGIDGMTASQAQQDVARAFAAAAKGADKTFRVVQTDAGDKVTGAAVVAHYAAAFRMVADHFGQPSKSAIVVVATLGAYSRAVPKGGALIQSALEDNKGDADAAVRALDAIRRGPKPPAEPKTAADLATTFVKGLDKVGALTDADKGDVFDILKGSGLFEALGIEA